MISGVVVCLLLDTLHKSIHTFIYVIPKEVRVVLCEIKERIFFFFTEDSDFQYDNTQVYTFIKDTV